MLKLKVLNDAISYNDIICQLWLCSELVNEDVSDTQTHIYFFPTHTHIYIYIFCFQHTHTHTNIIIWIVYFSNGNSVNSHFKIAQPI